MSKAINLEQIQKKMNLEDKEKMLNWLLNCGDVFYFIHSDKRDIGFDFKNNGLKPVATFNGLSLQVNIDIDDLEMVSCGKKVKIKDKDWKKVKLNSFKA
jgi:hypothetical protein